MPKYPKCPKCFERMYSVTVFLSGKRKKIGYYCSYCDKIYREVYIGLNKIDLRVYPKCH